MKQIFQNLLRLTRWIPGAWIDAGVAHLVRLICLIFTYKIVALYFGAPGVGAYGWVQSGLVLLFGLQTEGVTRFLNARIAGNALNQLEVRQVMGTAALTSLPGLLMAFATLYFWGPTMPFFSDSTPNFWWIASIFMVLVALYHHLLGIVLAGPDPQLYLTALPATAIWQCLILTGVATFTNNLSYTLLAIPSGQIFTLLILQPISTLRLHKFTFNLLQIKDAAHFLWMALVILIFGRLTEYLTVQWAISATNLSLTGLWQAGVRVSEALIAPWNVILTTLLLPQISKLVQNPNALRTAIWQWLKIALTGYGLVIVLLILAAPWVLEWLYSYQFTAGTKLFRWTLLADFLRIPAYLLATILVSARATQTFTLLEAASSILFLSALYFLQDRFGGLNAWPVANLIRYIFYLIALIYACRTYLWKPIH